MLVFLIQVPVGDAALDEDRFFDPVPGARIFPEILQQVVVKPPAEPQVVVRVQTN